MRLETDAWKSGNRTFDLEIKLYIPALGERNLSVGGAESSRQ